MQQYLCKIGFHRYVSLNTTNCLNTRYTDKNWTIQHMVWYQQCSCCGKRRMRDNYKNEARVPDWKHGGIEQARVQWETYGIMYLGNGVEQVADPPKPTKKKLTIIDGGKK